MTQMIFTGGQLRELAADHPEVKLYRAPSDRFWVNMVTRDHAETLVAEMHDDEADIYLALDGEGYLYLGGTIEHPTSPAPGQHRGTGLTGATCHHLVAGDLIVIPEGVPHMVDTRGSRLVYLVVKEAVRGA